MRKSSATAAKFYVRHHFYIQVPLRAKMKKSLISALLAATCIPALAGDYYVVVPVKGKTAAAMPISVSLGAYALPAGKVGTAYAGFDFNSVLSVTGDSSFASSGVTWAVKSGTSLPHGLALSAGGVLSGTPTTKNTAGAGFQVVAGYKTKSGQQAYTVVVNGQTLDVTSIALGSAHACAVTLAGGAKCWGRGSYGQLGNNATASSWIPVDVTGLTSGVAGITVAGGGLQGHSCALTTAGAVKCWGRNNTGQLGNGTLANSSVPVDVVGLGAGVQMVSAGSIGTTAGSTCAVVSGVAKCWGANAVGQLGDSSRVASSVPVDVLGLGSGVLSISAGSGFACAVTAARSAMCWGSNPAGQLGNNSTVDSPVPVQVSGLSSVSAISAGGSHACALTTGGGVKCWGFNGNGRLGNNSTTDSMVPVDVQGLSSGVTSISAGGAISCAVVSGAAKCWGPNTYGGLGDGTTAQSLVPVDVVGYSSGVSSISAGYNETCFVSSGGAAKCVGGNGVNGLFGNGTTTSSLTPVDVLNP